MEMSGKLQVEGILCLEKEQQVLTKHGIGWVLKPVAISWQTEKFLNQAYSTVFTILHN
jgi:hypothetical protein